MREIKKNQGNKMISATSCYVVAEIGINHNGDLETAMKLMREAKACGCDAVKFQKRTIDLVYTKEELAKLRDSPFGSTNRDLKEGLEFGKSEYQELAELAEEIEIDWYASPWDQKSIEFLLDYDIPYLKVPSALVTSTEYLQACASSGRPLLVSTGMCDLKMIKQAVEVILSAGGEIACLYHCTSTYPSSIDELNLRGIYTLQEEFSNIPIGYSGHEITPHTTLMAAVMGARSVERHMTLSRALWGTDQAASLEVPAFAKLVRQIRNIELASGDGQIRFYESEIPIAEKLRKVDDLFS
tara:strand:+ start:8527 stop:9420 length:894 start_codon:yes stop_codon:yes gene_type:complete